MLRIGSPPLPRCGGGARCAFPLRRVPSPSQCFALGPSLSRGAGEGLDVLAPCGYRDRALRGADAAGAKLRLAPRTRADIERHEGVDLCRFHHDVDLDLFLAADAL